MKKKNKLGFTLIEMLVVVLIIGILAAIALPQYQKSVEKSKASQALTLLQSIYQSAQVYRLTTGNWPYNVDQLDIDIPIDFKGEKWKIWFDSSSETNTLGVGITCAQGKYSGTGFAKYTEHSYAIIPKETNLCIERQKGNKPLFNGTRGSYCNKIFNGKAVYVSEKVNTNVWVLPLI